MSADEKTGRDFLRDAGISDPTPALVEMADEIVREVRDALAGDPTLNDYAGAITEIGDSAAADISLEDVAGSVDFLSYEHGFGPDGQPEPGLRGMVRANAYEIATGIAAWACEHFRPDPAEVSWDDVPGTSHGDRLIGRTSDGEYVYVSARPFGASGVAISGHTGSSAGQIEMSVDADEIEPAPPLTSGDVARIWRIWHDFHLKDAAPADDLDFLRARGVLR